MRDRAKTVNFAVIYGIGPFSLAQQLGVTNAEAKEFIDRYFERFPGVRRYLDEQIEKARDARLRRDADRPPALHPRDHVEELQHPLLRRARGDQRADPGLQRGPDQDRDDRDPPRAARRWLRRAHAAAGPRRAALRGAARELDR
jgi:hypothetical protein